MSEAGVVQQGCPECEAKRRMAAALAARVGRPSPLEFVLCPARDPGQEICRVTKAPCAGRLLREAKTVRSADIQLTFDEIHFPCQAPVPVLVSAVQDPPARAPVAEEKHDGA